MEPSEAEPPPIKKVGAVLRALTRMDPEPDSMIRRLHLVVLKMAALDELESSSSSSSFSSSSSSDEEGPYEEMNSALLMELARVKRTRIWEKPKLHGAFQHALNRWDDTEFRKFVRMTKRSFNNLCRILAPWLRKDKSHRQPLSVEQRQGLHCI